MKIRVFLTTSFLMSLVACGAPSIRQRALVHGAHPPYQRPEFVVLHNGFPLPTAGPQERRMRVTLRSAGYSVLEEQRIGIGSPSSGYVLEFRVDEEERAGDPGGVYAVALNVSKEHIPRLSRSSSYDLLVVWMPRGEGEPAAQLLRLESVDKKVLYLLAMDMEDPGPYLPEGLTLTRTEDPLFRTTNATLAGCPVDRTHYFVQVETSGRTGRLAPGHDGTFVANNLWLRVVVLDHSVAVVPAGCSKGSEGHNSYVIWTVSPSD